VARRSGVAAAARTTAAVVAQMTVAAAEGRTPLCVGVFRFVFFFFFFFFFVVNDFFSSPHIDQSINNRLEKTKKEKKCRSSNKKHSQCTHTNTSTLRNCGWINKEI
jgi:hypothetical protein